LDRETLALPEAAELLEAAVISNPAGAALFDRSGRLVIANPVADRLLGGTAVLGAAPPTRSLRDPATGGPVREEDLPIRRACEGAPFDDVELLVVDEDAQESGTYVRVSGRPVLRPQGEPAGAVISVFDDTAAKLTLQALNATQAELRRSNADLETFASTASHELSQPLHKIYAFAQLLRERGPLDDRADDFIDRIVTGCEQMRTLIVDLLTYSQLTTEARPFEAVELGDVVDEVLELFQQDVVESGARITVGTLPRVMADRTQMSQLFQNLVGNALRYVARGVSPVIDISGTATEHGWRFKVSDNGIGIEPEDRERAFSMFQRLVRNEEYAGTGIGLAVCARILDRHGGSIWIEDSPSGGTTLCFTLPERQLGMGSEAVAAPE
jgi:signal transduction histidine kinase